jgi:hypothetical protein
MNFEINLPRHPGHPDAINLNDLAIGKEIAVVCSYGTVVLQGVVRGLPDYNGEEWSGAKLDVDGKELGLNVYDAGIVCNNIGNWSENHSVATESL